MGVEWGGLHKKMHQACYWYEIMIFRRIGESPSYPPTITTTVDNEAHPGRRFTVTEDMKTAWQRGGAGGGGAKPRPKVESTPPPPPIPAR